MRDRNKEKVRERDIQRVRETVSKEKKKQGF